MLPSAAREVHRGEAGYQDGNYVLHRLITTSSVGGHAESTAATRYNGDSALRPTLKLNSEF
jgi:hypothetical protein